MYIEDGRCGAFCLDLNLTCTFENGAHGVVYFPLVRLQAAADEELVHQVAPEMQSQCCFIEGLVVV